MARSSTARKPRAQAAHFVPRPNSTFSKREISVVVASAQEIVGRGQSLTAPNFVKLAEDPTHPAHGLFEWDDERAGHNWRLDQAREYLSAVYRIDVIDVKPKKEYFSILVSQRKGAERQYEVRDRVLRSSFKLSQVKAQLRATIGAALRTAEDLGLCAADRAWKALADAVSRISEE